jgi:hypothetical protein
MPGVDHWGFYTSHGQSDYVYGEGAVLGLGVGRRWEVANS